MTKRLSEKLDVARLLSPDGRKSQQQQWEHHWTFKPQTKSAADRTPLLVFINRASGGRQGEATLVHLRALLSPQQVSTHRALERGPAFALDALILTKHPQARDSLSVQPDPPLA